MSDSEDINALKREHIRALRSIEILREVIRRGQGLSDYAINKLLKEGTE